MPATDTLPDALPVTGEDIAGPPKDSTISVDKLSQYFWEQFTKGLIYRRSKAIAWIMVRSYLMGYHYFRIDGGGWRPVPREDKKKPRSAVPVISPYYRHVLGMLNSNEMGVTTLSSSGDAKEIYKARSSETAINAWIDESDFRTREDEANQYLLAEGMMGYFRYTDPFRQTAQVRILPGSELFPIPYDARHPGELHGLMHASMASKSWLELQDDIFQRQTGQPPQKRMADRAKSVESSMHVNWPGLSIGHPGGQVDGALVITVWLRKTEQYPTGVYAFLVGDEIYRMAVGGKPGPDGQMVSQTQGILDDGEIPVEISYFDKTPYSFWGSGLCETLLPAQRSMDRQMTDLERYVKLNKPIVGYDSDSVKGSDIRSEDDILVPFSGNKLEVSRRPPLMFFSPQRMNRDVGSVISMIQTQADTAAGFRSGILFGQQEGRTEGGPATTLLSQNALAWMNAPLLRKYEAQRKTYLGINRLLPLVWPKEKRIQMVGPSNVGREIILSGSDLADSSRLILYPRPLLPGGRQMLSSLLFSLKQMPGADGKPGTEVSAREFRRSLQMMNMLPPGLEVEDRAEARIQQRINRLIGNGQQPFVPPAQMGNIKEVQSMENHRLAVDMLRRTLLDETFQFYGPPVQQALMMELRFHLSYTYGGTEHPNQVDDDLEKFESLQMENFLSAAEADLETPEGDFDLGV